MTVRFFNDGGAAGFDVFVPVVGAIRCMFGRHEDVGIVGHYRSSSGVVRIAELTPEEIVAARAQVNRKLPLALITAGRLKEGWWKCDYEEVEVRSEDMQVMVLEVDGVREVIGRFSVVAGLIEAGEGDAIALESSVVSGAAASEDAADEGVARNAVWRKGVKQCRRVAAQQR